MSFLLPALHRDLLLWCLLLPLEIFSMEMRLLLMVPVAIVLLYLLMCTNIQSIRFQPLLSARFQELRSVPAIPFRFLLVVQCRINFMLMPCHGVLNPAIHCFNAIR